MNDAQIEQQIQAKGLTAPRVTEDDIKAAIVSEHYFTAADGLRVDTETVRDVYHRAESQFDGSDAPLSLLTFCVLVLANGFTVTGESACVSPENFDAEIGRQIARKNAIEKIWPLMGFALADRLHAEKGQT